MRKNDHASQKSRRLLSGMEIDGALTLDERAASVGLDPEALQAAEHDIATYNVPLSEVVELLADDADTGMQGTSLTTVMIEAFLLTFKYLTEDEQVMLVGKYYLGIALKDLAVQLGVTEQKMWKLHEKVILEILGAVEEALEALL